MDDLDFKIQKNIKSKKCKFYIDNTLIEMEEMIEIDIEFYNLDKNQKPSILLLKKEGPFSGISEHWRITKKESKSFLFFYTFYTCPDDPRGFTTSEYAMFYEIRPEMFEKIKNVSTLDLNFLTEFTLFGKQEYAIIYESDKTEDYDQEKESNENLWILEKIDEIKYISQETFALWNDLSQIFPRITHLNLLAAGYYYKISSEDLVSGHQGVVHGLRFLFDINYKIQNHTETLELNDNFILFEIETSDLDLPNIKDQPEKIFKFILENYNNLESLNPNSHILNKVYNINYSTPVDLILKKQIQTKQIYNKIKIQSKIEDLAWYQCLGKQ